MMEYLEVVIKNDEQVLEVRNPTVNKPIDTLNVKSKVALFDTLINYWDYHIVAMAPVKIECDKVSDMKYLFERKSKTNPLV